MNRLSLRVKIIIGLVGIVALIEAALLLVVYNRFSTVMDNELVTTGIAIAGNVAANSAQLIPTDNIFASIASSKTPWQTIPTSAT